MNATELAEYSRLKSEFDRLSGVLDTIEPGTSHSSSDTGPSSSVRDHGAIAGDAEANGGGAEWRTPDGRAVKVLKPEQRLASTVQDDNVAYGLRDARHVDRHR